MEEIHTSWSATGHGSWLDGVGITHVAWADDTWVLASTQSGLDSMVSQLSPHAWKTAGLAIHWDKCAYAEATREVLQLPDDRSAPMLAQMHHHGQGACLR